MTKETNCPFCEHIIPCQSLTNSIFYIESLFMTSSWCNVYISDDGKWHSWPWSPDAGCPDLWLTLTAHITACTRLGPAPAHMGEWRAQSAHTDIRSPPGPRLRKFYPILPIFSSLNTRRSERENSAWCNWLYKRVYMQACHIAITCENIYSSGGGKFLKLMGDGSGRHRVIFHTESMFCVID